MVIVAKVVGHKVDAREDKIQAHDPDPVIGSACFPKAMRLGFERFEKSRSIVSQVALRLASARMRKEEVLEASLGPISTTGKEEDDKIAVAKRRLLETVCDHALGLSSHQDCCPWLDTQASERFMGMRPLIAR